MKLLRILGILFLLLSAGCGPAAPEQGGYTVTDVRGKTVHLLRPPRKILTDSLHLDETLLTLVPADHLAGACYLDRESGISFIAEETRSVEPVLREVTPETVAGTKPDLFLASTWSDPGLIQKVEELGIPVVVCRGPVTLEEIREIREILRIQSKVLIGIHIIDVHVDHIQRDVILTIAGCHLAKILLGGISPSALSETKCKFRGNIAASDHMAKLLYNIIGRFTFNHIHIQICICACHFQGVHSGISNIKGQF